MGANSSGQSINCHLYNSVTDSFPLPMGMARLYTRDVTAVDFILQAETASASIFGTNTTELNLLICSTVCIKY